MSVPTLAELTANHDPGDEDPSEREQRLAFRQWYKELTFVARYARSVGDAEFRGRR